MPASPYLYFQKSLNGIYGFDIVWTVIILQYICNPTRYTTFDG